MRWKDEAVMQSAESPSACLVYPLNITKMDKKTLPAEKICSLFQHCISGRQVVQQSVCLCRPAQVYTGMPA
jgi:hypothetical protein